jgi:hypothetical protein
MAHFSFHHCHLSLCYHQMPSNKIMLCLCIGTQKIIQNVCPLYLLNFNVHAIWIYVLNSIRAWHPITQTYEPIFVTVLLFSTYALQPYCAIWVRRSNFYHKASPRVSSRESTQRRKEKLWTRNVRKFRLNADLHVTFRDLLHAVKLRHGTNGFTSPPKEGVLRIFFSLKIRRLRPGANPRTWVPKASTLPLDHRSRFVPVLVNRMLLYFFFFHVPTLTLGEEVGCDS